MKSVLLFSIFTLVVITSAFSARPGKFSQWLDEKPSGWYNVTSFSLATTSGQYMNGMQTIFGYKVKPRLGVGIGVGIERFTAMHMYDVYKANLSMLPVFADVRYTLIKSTISPFVAVDAGFKILLNIPSTQYTTHTDTIYPGYAWNTWYDYDTYKSGGWFVNCEAGIKVRVCKRLSLNGSFGYSLWSVSGTRNTFLYQFLPASQGGVQETDFLSTLKTKAIIHSFLFRLGFSF